MIGGKTLLRILSCCRNVPRLHSCRRYMFFRRVLPLGSSWLMLNTARAAGIRDAAVIHDRRIVDDGFVDISVVNHGRIHTHDSRVIREVTAAPLSTGKARSHKSEAVVHAAVVPDMSSPVAAVEEVMSGFPAPVRRRPKITRLGCRNPGARHPVIANIRIVIVSPISGRPHITIRGARRLFINNQRRRCDTDTDHQLCKG